MKPWLVFASLAVVVLVLLVGLPAPVPSASAGPPGAPRAVAPHAVAALGSAPAHPRPSTVYCPSGYPAYGAVGGVGPITPNQIFQGPCAPINQDEVHLTFSSNAPGSGESMRLPVYLPPDGSALQSNAYIQMYVGMVVRGDRHSQWGQSYAEVVFTPFASGSSLNYTATVAVLSLLNSSNYVADTCPATALNFTFNQSYFCEISDLAGSSPAFPAYPAGSWINVTFAGTIGGTTGLNISIGDLANSSLNTSTTLNTTTTGTYTFEPYFNASCPDACLLNWSMPFGLGVSYLTCPIGPQAFATCDTYNQTTWDGVGAWAFGVPKYAVGPNFTADYLYVAPESASGVCNPFATVGTLATCFNQDAYGGTGFYPWFTFNGTVLNFGDSLPSTTNDFGGATTEMFSTGAPHDMKILFFNSLTNSSRAGFVTTGGTVNVTANPQTYGTLSGASLTYSVAGGTATTVPMTRWAGGATDAMYSATIPSGVNGLINFTVTATNRAGATVTSPTAHVERGPLPVFTVSFQTWYPSCANIVFNGTAEANGSSASVNPGFYPVAAHGCYPWVFSSFSLDRGLSVSPAGAPAGTLAVSASGLVLAHWNYVRPIDQITLLTTCGQIYLDGNYSNNGTQVLLPDWGNYSLGQVGCAGETFAGWSFTGNLTILGARITPRGNGTLTANWVPTTSANTVQFATTPATCGGIAIRGAGYTNGQSIGLAAGSYPIAPDPCYHYGWLRWNTTGGVSISGGTLSVTGAGVITEVNFVLTIVTIVVSPAGCGTVTFDGTAYRNSSQIVVQNNTTHTISASSCTGYYLFGLNGTGGIQVVGNVAVVNGSGYLIATNIPGQPDKFVGFLTDPPTCGIIDLGAASFVNTNYTYVARYSVLPISTVACGGYGFVRWITYGGISIAGDTAYINDSGAIEAVFRPLVAVYLYTQPAGCGSISLNGVTYPGNSTVILPEEASYPLSATPCAGYRFTGWSNSTSAEIGGGFVFLTNSAILTAQFAQIRYLLTVLVYPANCGSVRLAGANLPNGSALSLPNGIYPLVAAPCSGSYLVAWAPQGNVSVVNNTLYLNGSGSVGAIYRPVAPVVTLSVPASSLSGSPVPLAATVAVLVPPYTYNYTWSFGDGATATTPVNFTSHTYAAPGTYTVEVTVLDPFNRTANATTTLVVVAPPALSNPLFTPSAIAALGLVGLAVVLVLVLAIWRSRQGGGPGEASETPGPATEPAPPGPDEALLPEESPKP